MGVLPSILYTVSSAMDAIVLPLNFVAMSLLLFGIGMHLHLLHLNPIRQLRKSPHDSSSGGDEHDS